MSWIKLKDYLRENGISQNEAAEKLGVKKQYLSDVLREKRFPRKEFVDKVEKEFGIVIKKFDEDDVCKVYEKELEGRILKSIKSLPESMDEFVMLMVGSWRVGVRDTIKLLDEEE